MYVIGTFHIILWSSYANEWNICLKIESWIHKRKAQKYFRWKIYNIFHTHTFGFNCIISYVLGSKKLRGFGPRPDLHNRDEYYERGCKLGSQIPLYRDCLPVRLESQSRNNIVVGLIAGICCIGIVFT